MLFREKPMPVMSPSALGKLEPVLDLVDEKFGPVKAIYGIKLGNTQPPWWVFHAELTRPLGLYFADYECDAWGSSVDKDEALFKCLGEVLERYCMYNASVFDETQVLPASACTFLSELPVCALEEACNPSYKKVDPNWKLTQVRVTEVANGEQHWLPAGYIHFNFHGCAGEPSVILPHSSGSAFHETLERAVWAGLCEVAERDAFSLFWLNQWPVKEIAVEDSMTFMSGDSHYDLAQRLSLISSAGLKLRCFDITTDFNVPTVFAIAQGAEYPFATFGAACSVDPIRAICKAIDEVFLVRAAQLSGTKTAKVPSFSEFSWVSSLRDHSDLYALWKDTPAFDFFINEKNEKQSVSDFKNRTWWSEPESFSKLEEFCSMLQRELGFTVLYSDCTLDDVSQFGKGVKVCVPQMLPISVADSMKWLGCPRLALHAAKHSLKKASNPYPHPFP